MEKLDEGLKTLLEQGKEKGYLTFTQVNDYLPDEAINPEKLDQLLMTLDEQGIEIIDKPEGGAVFTLRLPRDASRLTEENKDGGGGGDAGETGNTGDAGEKGA